MVRLLLELGADVGATDDDGRTPLHHAAEQGWVDNVRFLLRHDGGRAIRKPDARGITPLGCATRCVYDIVRKSMARTLLRFGEDPTLPDDGLNCEIDQCINLLWNTDAFRILADAGAWAPPASGTHVSSAVAVASTIQQHAQLNWFAKAGFKFSELQDFEHWSPFTFAAVTCGLPTMKLLVRLGADPRLRDGAGRSALHLFCVAMQSSTLSADEVVRYLVKTCGIDPDWREKETEETALHKAARLGYVDVIRALLRYGASVNPVCEFGTTAFLRPPTSQMYRAPAILLHRSINSSIRTASTLLFVSVDVIDFRSNTAH
jgi:ankyrin repeat protein